jgi:hypothetical protein
MKKINYDKEYDKIPLAILFNAGFPTNSVWLDDGQRRLLEWVFDEYHEQLYLELTQCQEYIEELEEDLK